MDFLGADMVTRQLLNVIKKNFFLPIKFENHFFKDYLESKREIGILCLMLSIHLLPNPLKISFPPLSFLSFFPFICGKIKPPIGGNCRTRKGSLLDLFQMQKKDIKR